MARRRTPFKESLTYEIYECYKGHAMTEKTFPNPHAFWNEILVPVLDYQLNWGSMQYHWMKLQIEKNPDTGQPYIVIDPQTKAVTVPELDVIEKSSRHEDLL